LKDRVKHGYFASAKRNEIMSLKGKSAVITGSTSGIGLGFARALAAQGVNVMLNGLGDTAEIEAVRAGLTREHGVTALYSPANMLKGDEIAAMVREAEAAFSTVDILINNAGIQHVAPIDEFPDDKWEAVIRINLMSSFHSIKAALPGMKKRGWGRVINLSSAHSLVASPYKSAYVAAKHGIAGLTKTVALEVAQQGITVNAIAPGYVWTPLVANQIPDTMKARGLTEEQVKRDVLLAAQPTKQFVTIEQVAELMLFLCSDAAGAITGSTYSIDGGWTAQ
jgi:3-hydroxybutyrate dehydrogenase